MNLIASKAQQQREKAINAAALLALCVIGALAVFGPAGVLAWSENTSKLASHELRIAALQEQRATLENRKNLLDPNNVDPDLASELVRGNLNVAHPDEYVVILD